jgi:hypothetical protein
MRRSVKFGDTKMQELIFLLPKKFNGLKWFPIVAAMNKFGSAGVPFLGVCLLHKLQISILNYIFAEYQIVFLWKH